MLYYSISRCTFAKNFLSRSQPFFHQSRFYVHQRQSLEANNDDNRIEPTVLRSAEKASTQSSIEKSFYLHWEPPRRSLFKESWERIYEFVSSSQYSNALENFRSLQSEYPPSELSLSYFPMLLLLSYYKAPLEMIGTLCDEMKMKNIQFDERYYTALILANLLHQKYDDAFELLEEMKNKGLTPSTAHYTLTYHFFFFIRHPKVYHLFNEILAASFIKPLELYNHLMQFLFRKKQYLQILDLFLEMKRVSHTSHPRFDQGIGFSLSDDDYQEGFTSTTMDLLLPMYQKTLKSNKSTSTSLLSGDDNSPVETTTSFSLSTLPKVTLKASSPIPNSNTYRAVIRTLGRLTRYADLVNLWCDLRVTSWYPYESFISQNFLHALVETKNFAAIFVLVLDMCMDNVPIDRHFFRSFLYLTFGSRSSIKLKLPTHLLNQINDWQRYVSTKFPTNWDCRRETIEREIQARLQTFCVDCLQILLKNNTHKPLTRSS